MNVTTKAMTASPDATVPAIEAEPRVLYTIVAQVKSMRVVYFTDDGEYQPVTEADWYYVSTYEGTLPEGMTLRNCWRWRFNGSKFVDAGGRPDPSRKEKLIDANRKALRRILHDKIDEIRGPYLPSCAGGDATRQLKLDESRAYLQQPAVHDAYPMLEALAVARNFSLHEAAELVSKRAAQTTRLLVATERVREQFEAAIAGAKDEAVLIEVRTALIDKAYPELSAQFAHKVRNTEPVDLDKPLDDVHRNHEIARLKATLREHINLKRKALDSQYIQNDAALKHKARLAQMVLANQGEAPPDVDAGVLATFAEARGLTVLEAAQIILQSLTQAGDVLTETEMIKDRMLARVEAAKTLRDVRELSKVIEKL